MLTVGRAMPKIRNSRLENAPQKQEIFEARIFMEKPVKIDTAREHQGILKKQQRIGTLHHSRIKKNLCLKFGNTSF